MLSPELKLLTPETAMRDAGIRKFVNPYSKKAPVMEPVQEVQTKDSGQVDPVEEEEKFESAES